MADLPNDPSQGLLTGAFRLTWLPAAGGRWRRLEPGERIPVAAGSAVEARIPGGRIAAEFVAGGLLVGPAEWRFRAPTPPSALWRGEISRRQRRYRWWTFGAALAATALLFYRVPLRLPLPLGVLAMAAVLAGLTLAGDALIRRVLRRRYPDPGALDPRLSVVLPVAADRRDAGDATGPLPALPAQADPSLRAALDRYRARRASLAEAGGGRGAEARRIAFVARHLDDLIAELARRPALLTPEIATELRLLLDHATEEISADLARRDAEAQERMLVRILALQSQIDSRP